MTRTIDFFVSVIVRIETKVQGNVIKFLIADKRIIMTEDFQVLGESNEIAQGKLWVLVL